MWYWIVMAVLVIGCIALLSGTFFSIKKNKAEEAAKRAEARKKKRKKPADAEEAQQPGETEKSRWWTAEQPGRRERAAAGCTGTSGRSTQGAGRAEKRAEKTPPVESNPGRPGFVDKVQFYFLQ